MGKLSHGPYLLSITTQAGSAKMRHDLVFRVR
jgi:hypothetical protein